MRIAIAGIMHEALTFSPILAKMEDFRVLRDEEIIRLLHGQEIIEYPEYPGVADVVQRMKIEPVPILFARSLSPSGIVEESTYLQLKGEILEGLQQAGNLDGICLVLHGAMLVENIEDGGDTELVRSIREVMGDDILISAMLDLHANLTEEFANKTDIWAGYRTAPHRDQLETLERALSSLAHCIHLKTRPKPVFIRLPLLLQGEKATTDTEPMKSLLAMAAEIEKQLGILNAEVLVGFAWSDAPHAGSNVAVIAESSEHLPKAREEAMRLAQEMWDRRDEFTFDQEVIASVDEAIETALHAPESTVFISDSGDNPTAGAPGDATYFLSRLLAKEVPDAVFASIPDEAATRMCFDAGLGATVTVSLGGKMDKVHGDSVEVMGVVEHLYQPEQGVKEAAIATLRVGGVRILVTDIREFFLTLDSFRKTGVEPLEHKIVVVKLGYLFPDLRKNARREILALSPGYANMDLTCLPFEHITRPIFPLDRDFEWEPTITNAI